MSHKISQTGINLIKEFEGLYLYAYQDSVGVWTIGYGTTNSDKGITGQSIGPGLTISKHTAENWLTLSLNKKYGPKVDKYDSTYHWTQKEFDALISFAYNIGSIDELVSKGKLPKHQIPEIMKKYIKAGGKVLKGLVKRRQKEAELFTKNMESNLLPKPMVKAAPFGDVSLGSFVVQKPINLKLENSDYKFLVGSGTENPHLYYIRKNGSGTNKVEVHVLNGNDNYNSFLLRTPTCLDDVGNEFDFLLGETCGNGFQNLYCIKKRKTGKNKTEVHILSADSEYKHFLSQRSTCLHEVGDEADFALGDFFQNGKLDLFCFLKKGTGSHKTEVHILNGDDNFTSFLKQLPTAMPETNNNYKFVVGNYNRENSVFCVEKKNTGSHSTEIKILNRENLYEDFVLNIPTKL